MSSSAQAPQPASNFFRRLGAISVVGLWLLLVPAAIAQDSEPGASGAEVSEAETSRAETSGFEFPEAFGASPEQLLAAAEAVEVGEEDGIVLLLRRNVYSFDESARMSHREHSIFLLRDQQSVESAWSIVDRQWAPWFQNRPDIRARVITKDGVRELDPETLVESPTADEGLDMFDDRLQLEAPLPGLRPGAVVEVEVIVEGHKPYFAAGTSGRHYLVSGPAIAREEVVLEAPTSMPLRFELLGLAEGGAALEEIEQDGLRRVQVVRLEVPSFEAAEPGLPYDVQRYPNFAYSIGKSWRAVADAYGQVVDEQLAGADVSALVADVDRQADWHERTDAALAAIQERVRYTGLELSSASLVPRSPAETLAREFGDCKDKSALLVAALDAVDVEAHIALLRSGFDADVPAHLPGLGLFNHAIVRVPHPDGGEPLWIDPTVSFARAGQLPISVQGRQALVTGADAEQLELIPASSSADNRVVETRDIRLAEIGPGQVIETTDYHGYAEPNQRSYLNTGEQQRREGYERYVKSRFQAETLSSFEETAARDLDRHFTLRLEASDAAFAVTDLDEATVELSLSGLLSDVSRGMIASQDDEADEPAEPRQVDFVQTTPHITEYRFRVTPPPGFVVRELPPDRDEPLGAAHLEQKFTMDGEVVTGFVRFDSGARRMDPTTLELTQLALAELSAEDSPVLAFDHRSSIDMAAGRARKAIQDLRADIGEENKALDHVRLSRALLGIGLGAEARRAARQAIELEPELAIAHWNLGFVLSHDEIGRLREKGYDHQGARAALERAVELDGDDATFLSELAILLDFDADGRRYSQTADMATAIEHYRAWREKFGSGLDVNLISSLAMSDSWQELLDFTDELQPGTTRNAWRIAALAKTADVDRALLEARRLARDRDDRANVLAGAARGLLRVRHYEESAALMRQVASVSNNPAQIQIFAEMLAETRRAEELELPADDPASVLKESMLLVMTPDSRAEDFIQLMHPDTQTGESQEESAIEEAFETVSRLFQQAGGDLPIQVLIEIGIALLDATVEGNDALGYRVELRSEADPTQPGMVAYVEPDDEGAFRVTAIEETASLLGYEVLRRLDAGDHEGARQWLDWARDHFDADEQTYGDPLLADAFAIVWRPGLTDVTASTMRLAAHLLMAEDAESAEDTIEPLEKAREQHAEDPALLFPIEIALSEAYGTVERWTDAQAIRRHLYEQHPESEMAYRSYFFSHLIQDQYDEARSVANGLLNREGADRDQKILALITLTQLAMVREDYSRLDELIAEIEKIDPASAAPLYNEAAWADLFEQPVPEGALEAAQQAAHRENFEQYSSAHTLATAYGLFDRPLEAYRVLLQAMAANPEHELDGPDWLVFGLIAESCGLEKAAREYYARLEEPEEGVALSSWQLAQQRLEALDAQAKG